MKIDEEYSVHDPAFKQYIDPLKDWASYVRNVWNLILKNVPIELDETEVKVEDGEELQKNIAGQTRS